MLKAEIIECEYIHPYNPDEIILEVEVAGRKYRGCLNQWDGGIKI